MITTIDLSRTTDKAIGNLAGKERGESARTMFGLDALDGLVDTVEVVVPSGLYSISPSYFLGLFSKSISKLGGPDAFLGKYRFKASPAILEQVYDGIQRATASRSPL